MKRAGVENDGPSKMLKGAPAAPGKDGGNASGSGNQDGAVDPIPRLLKSNSVTLHFVQRTWEEVGPGELKFCPMSLTPYYFFAKEANMIRQLNKFKGLWETMEIHTPKIRISNLIMLQDELTNQAGTPMETTAFTQACYLLTYQPVAQQQYYQLNDTSKTIEGVPLTYKISREIDNKVSHLKTFSGYSNFEHLGLCPSVVNPEGMDGEGLAENLYLRPGEYAYYNSDRKIDNGSFYSIKATTEKVGLDYSNTIFHCRNQDTIKLHKYGDSFEIPVHTNLEGKYLLNDRRNDFIVNDIRGKNDSMFLWPGAKRPYYVRHNLCTDLQPMLNIQDLKPLQHTFITMPPIKKASGDLLKQRCSFIMEQEMSITLHMCESVFDTDTFSNDTIKAVPMEAYMNHQKDAIVLRGLKTTNDAGNFIANNAVIVN